MAKVNMLAIGLGCLLGYETFCRGYTEIHLRRANKVKKLQIERDKKLRDIDAEFKDRRRACYAAIRKAKNDVTIAGTKADADLLDKLEKAYIANERLVDKIEAKRSIVLTEYMTKSSKWL